MKTVLMDLFGVASPTGEFKKEILYPICPDLLEAQVDTNYREFEFGRIDERTFWQRAGWDTESGRAEIMKRVTIDPKLREVIAYLKRRNYLVVLFSSFPKPWLDEVVRKNGIGMLFDKVLATGSWGYDKNNPALYVKAKQQFGECVMVDDKAKYLQLAGRAGIETVWKKAAMESTSFAPNHVINYLDELKAVL
jgi:FMN phosphatase YigB (HAD superfamily)